VSPTFSSATGRRRRLAVNVGDTTVVLAVAAAIMLALRARFGCPPGLTAPSRPCRRPWLPCGVPLPLPWVLPLPLPPPPPGRQPAVAIHS